MTAVGTGGNGKTVTGTGVGGGRATATAFEGGKNATAEPQNQIHKRIKDETCYLESLVLFEDAEEFVNKITPSEEEWTEDIIKLNIPGVGEIEVGGTEYTGQYFSADVEPTRTVPRSSIYKFDNAIGDAYLDGDTQSAPAWKIVTLQGNISASATKDVTLSTGYDVQVPQLNIDLHYKTSVQPANFDFDPANLRKLIAKTPPFADNRIVVLESDDALVYADEMNTQVLSENFDIEVFEFVDSGVSANSQNLNRKYFEKRIPQVVQGFMRSAQQQENPEEELTTNSVEYYFDVLVDAAIEPQVACKGAAVFNKQSYYVDLDFDCDHEKGESSYYDIYGKNYDIYGNPTEPEICQN